MALRVKGQTYPVPISILKPKDRTATTYSDVIDCCPDGNQHRELAVTVACDALTNTSASATPTLQYAAALTNVAAYDYTTAGDTWVTLRYNTNDQVKLAHKFTTAGTGAAATATIFRAKFYMKQVGTVAAAKYVWATLEGDSSGPDGTAVQTSAKILANSISSTGEYITFEFHEPIALTASTVYYVVLQGDWTLSTSNHLAVKVDTVASGGTLYVYDSGWANTTTQSPNTLCDAIGTWTSVTPLPAAFDAITAVNEDEEDYGTQTRYLDACAYGRFVRLVLTETATWTTNLCYANALLMGPKNGH